MFTARREKAVAEVAGYNPGTTVEDVKAKLDAGTLVWCGGCDFPTPKTDCTEVEFAGLLCEYCYHDWAEDQSQVWTAF